MKCECWHNPSRQSYKTNFHLDKNKSTELWGKTFVEARLKMVVDQNPQFEKGVVLDADLPFWSTNITRGHRTNCQDKQTGNYQKTQCYAVCLVHKVIAGVISLKYIHKNVSSSPKHETQNVLNYTSLSCQNRARNIEYASTSYNDFKISQKHHQATSQSVQTS